MLFESVAQRDDCGHQLMIRLSRATTDIIAPEGANVFHNKRFSVWIPADRPPAAD
jgi:hypothetical protein